MNLNNSEGAVIIVAVKKTISLRRRLLLLVVICWSVPVLLIMLFVTVSYRNSIINKTEGLMEEWVKNCTTFYGQKLNEAIEISKKISYDGNIEESWKRYKNGKMDYADFYANIIGELKTKYYNDNRFVMSVFYLTDDPEHIYYTSRQPVNYINIYKEQVAQKAHKISEKDTSDAHMEIIGGKIYIIRNLYTITNYTKFGTLVIELNQDKLFSGLIPNKDYEFGFTVNDTSSLISTSANLNDSSKIGILNKLMENDSIHSNGKIIKVKNANYIALYYPQKFDDYRFCAVLVADINTIYAELHTIYTIIFLILIIIIPVFIYMIYFISFHIRNPISRLIAASKELEKGKIGMQIEGEPMPNTEFLYMKESFNRMSKEIKYIFDYAYHEELAKKEAKILALQSQINPHFLNNTLEMMNWQARMAGDTEVTKMIEALGTLLDYSMDRSNKKSINLSEELRCADAYFYIISMRFGQRLIIERDIDESLLQIKVPQLILQPIIENAVVHGVEAIKNGEIKLKVYRDGNNVILQVLNTGKPMSEEDMKRVQDILEGKLTSGDLENAGHVSMGIRNVNERIKLIYGEEYGLTIESVEEGVTASTITIPSLVKGAPEREKLMKYLLNKSE